MVAQMASFSNRMSTWVNFGPHNPPAGPDKFASLHPEELLFARPSPVVVVILLQLPEYKV